MVAHCSKLMADEALAFRISRSAAVTAKTYTWDRVARETAAFYQSRLDAKVGEAVAG
jgi:hypothetical protein